MSGIMRNTLALTIKITLDSYQESMSKLIKTRIFLTKS